jgi:hypothetical protein
MKTPEGKLKDEIKEYLSSLDGCFFFMPVPTGYGERGIQDIIGCLFGFYFGIEVKVRPNKETPWQARMRLRTKTAGGQSIVAYDIQDVKDMVGVIQRKA